MTYIKNRVARYTEYMLSLVCGKKEKAYLVILILSDRGEGLKLGNLRADNPVGIRFWGDTTISIQLPLV